MNPKTSNNSFSKENLGKYRNHWWNDDFINLMTQRWQLNRVDNILDVGCGIGHWSKTLFPHLSERATITGIDINEKLLDEAIINIRETSYGNRFSVKKADIYSLPFEENSFDMVTAQTLFIHINDVMAALKEVFRVLKPGGLIALVEPNNLAQELFFNNLNKDNDKDKIIESIRFNLIREQEKINAAKGNDSIGYLLPEYLIKAGYKNVTAYASDRINLIYPPYDTSTQIDIISQLKTWNKDNENFINAINNNEYYSAIPTLFILVSGKK